MHCIVTGAAGFIGSHLCDALLLEGHEVLGIDDLSTGRESNLKSAQVSPHFHFLKKDVTKIKASDLDGQKIDWIFHLAGRADLVPSIQKPEEYFATNTNGTFRMLELARAIGAKRF